MKNSFYTLGSYSHSGVVNLFLLAYLYRKQKMSSLLQKRNSEREEQNQKSSQDCNQFPMPRLKTKKSKFASDVESDSARNEQYHSVKKSTAKKSALALNEQVSEQAYWGKVKPYCFDPQTNTPRIIITPHFLRSLLLNLFIISVVCAAIPVLTNRNMFKQVLTPSGRNLEQSNGQEHLGRLLMVSARYVGRKYSIYIYSAAWTLYQLTFLIVLLIGNPGYGDPLAQKQLSLQEQNQIITHPQGRKLQGYSRCSTCKAIVDNSVFHCPQCDICCQGFTHHCQWIGKCVGYRSQIFLNAYYYGFFVGIAVLVLLILVQSIPFE